jgi:hypothetical protein
MADNMTISRVATIALLLLTTGAGSASAQVPIEDEPQPQSQSTIPPPIVVPAPPAFPDGTLQVLRGRLLSISLRGGNVLVGEILGFDAYTITFELSPTRAVVAVGRGDIAAIQVVDTPSSPPNLTLTPPEPPLSKRYFGLQLGLAPSVMLDLQVSHFYAFFNADFVLPTADNTLYGFALGAGATFALGNRSHWNMDIFAHLDFARVSDNDGLIVGGGAGFGFHYTANNGFTLGFKVPIFGYSGLAHHNDDADNSSAAGLAGYYLTALMSLPIVHLGYRF